MGAMQKRWYEAEARKAFPGRREDNFAQVHVEIPDRPDVSSGSNPGAWVAAWVWVPDPPARKEATVAQHAAPAGPAPAGQ